MSDSRQKESSQNQPSRPEYTYLTFLKTVEQYFPQLARHLILGQILKEVDSSNISLQSIRLSDAGLAVETNRARSRQKPWIFMGGIRTGTGMVNTEKQENVGEPLYVIYVSEKGYVVRLNGIHPDQTKPRLAFSIHDTLEAAVLAVLRFYQRYSTRLGK